MAELIEQHRVFKVSFTEEEVKFLEGYLQNYIQPESEGDYGLKMRSTLFSFFKSFNLNIGIR